MQYYAETSLDIIMTNVNIIISKLSALRFVEHTSVIYRCVEESCGYTTSILPNFYCYCGLSYIGLKPCVAKLVGRTSASATTADNRSKLGKGTTPIKTAVVAVLLGRFRRFKNQYL